MNRFLCIALSLLVAAGAHAEPAETEQSPINEQAESAAQAEFRPLFNGKNLEGWVRVNTAESTWSVADGMLVCTGKPIGELRTTRMYQNFVLEVEWRHMRPKGNAGIFVWADDITSRGVPFHRSIEVQVLENAYGNTRGYTTHGDIFPIHGATMTPVNGRGGSRAFPTENRSNPSPEWNHYRIECRDGEVALSVNGKLVTQGKDCNPRKGYICIESEGGIVHYRNMRIQELPDSAVLPEQVAVADRGYRSLYNGIDLAGWTATGEWKTADWTLQHVAHQSSSLTHEQSLGNVGFIFDVKLSDKASKLDWNVRGASVVVSGAEDAIAEHLLGGQWNRIEGSMRDKRLTVLVNGQQVLSRVVESSSAKGPLRLEAQGRLDLANVYVRELND